MVCGGYGLLLYFDSLGKVLFGGGDCTGETYMFLYSNRFEFGLFFLVAFRGFLLLWIVP